MTRASIQILAVAAIAGLCLISLAGCGRKQITADQYRQIINDPSLTMDQKQAKLTEPEGGPVVGFLEGPGGIVVGAAVLLAVSLALRSKMEGRKPASSGSPAAKAKAAINQPADKRPQPADAAPPATQRPIQPTPSPITGTSAVTSINDPAADKTVAYSNRAAVKAIPLMERGASFFTSQPLPLDLLEPVTVTMRNVTRHVMATPEEAQRCRSGSVPMVRAFTVNRQTMPWYEWQEYEPYNRYHEAVAQDWQGLGHEVVACWMSAEKCDPGLRGYSWLPPEMASLNDESASATGGDDDAIQADDNLANI